MVSANLASAWSSTSVHDNPTPRPSARDSSPGEVSRHRRSFRRHPAQPSSRCGELIEADVSGVGEGQRCSVTAELPNSNRAPAGCHRCSRTREDRQPVEDSFQPAPAHVGVRSLRPNLGSRQRRGQPPWAVSLSGRRAAIGRCWLLPPSWHRHCRRRGPTCVCASALTDGA
jgi:hypothetical protein